MSALKIVVPLLVVAGLLTFILPLLLIWFVNDIENNITVTGSNAGVWTVFQHGMNMVALIFGESAWLIGIILIVVAIALVCGGLVVVVKRLGS